MACNHCRAKKYDVCLLWCQLWFLLDVLMLYLGNGTVPCSNCLDRAKECTITVRKGRWHTQPLRSDCIVTVSGDYFFSFGEQSKYCSWLGERSQISLPAFGPVRFTMRLMSTPKHPPEVGTGSRLSLGFVAKVYLDCGSCSAPTPAEPGTYLFPYHTVSTTI